MEILDRFQLQVEFPSWSPSCASGDGPVEPGWLSARLVTDEMEGSASKGPGWGPGLDLLFQQLGSSFQSSPSGLDDQLLSLRSLAPHPSFSIEEANPVDPSGDIQVGLV